MMVPVDRAYIAFLEYPRDHWYVACLEGSPSPCVWFSRALAEESCAEVKDRKEIFGYEIHLVALPKRVEVSVHQWGKRAYEAAFDLQFPVVPRPEPIVTGHLLMGPDPKTGQWVCACYAGRPAVFPRREQTRAALATYPGPEQPLIWEMLQEGVH